MSNKDAKILKKEIRFAWHIPKTDNRDDYHYVKEQVTYEDGRIVPRSYLVKDFERPVYVTAPSYRNHKEKKEFEYQDKLLRQMTTESDLPRTAATLLGVPYLANQPKELKASPYLYAYDIPSASFVKYTSLKRNEFIQSRYSVAVLDIETNPKTDEILMVTITYKGTAYVVIKNHFLKGVKDAYNRIKDAIKFYLPEYEGLKLTIGFHDNDVEMLNEIFEYANKLAPDFLAIWNMDFDIGKILETLKRYNINPADVICDKKIPRGLRVCRYKKGLTKKVTASGVVKPINPSLQWHTLMTTSTFYVIDAMCVYRQLRMAKAEEPSYSLDAILQKELNKRKLKFTQADAYKGLEWHLFMQANYPVEYVVYNIYDCLAVEELDEKTNDLGKALPDFAGITEFQKFNSQSRKLTDALFLFGLDSQRVIGTACPPPRDDEVVEDIDLDDTDDDEEIDENDPSRHKTLDLKGWIQLLPQNRLIPRGLKCLEDYPEVRTSVRGITCDFDARSSYPSCTQVGNVSKETCVNEVISIDGLHEDVFREQNLSVCLGNANMLEYFEVMFGLPTISEISDMIDRGEI